MSMEDWASQRFFVWRRAGLVNDAFELRLPYGEELVLATMRIGRLRVPTAYVDSEGSRFVLTGEGVGCRRVRISDASTRTVVANFERRWTGRNGTFAFVNGSRLAWRRPSLLQATQVFTDRFSNPLLRFSPTGDVHGYGLGFGLEPSIGSWRDLMLLLSLGWFLLLLRGPNISTGHMAPRLPSSSSAPPEGAVTRDAWKAA
jgi:hypothetical protein